MTDDGALVRGLWWTPPNGRRWKTAVILTHPRGDFSVHYACPLLAAAGFAVLGFSTRDLNNDTDCLHDLAARASRPPAWVRDRVRRRSCCSATAAEAPSARSAQVEHGCGDGWVGVAAHPGEGVFMLQAIDPSVADERDPFSVVTELDMYAPENGWRPWPEPSRYDRDWLDAYRAAAGRAVARIDAHAGAAERRGDAPVALRDCDAGSADWRYWRKRAVHMEYMTIYRTLADPAYLDPTIDPDDRPLGSLFACPGPVRRQLRARRPGPDDDLTRVALDVVGTVVGGQARRHDAGRARARARRARDRRYRDPRPAARAIADAAGSDDVTYEEIAGVPHYLEGHRPAAMALVADWIRARFP